MRRLLLLLLVAVAAAHTTLAQGHSGSCTCGGFATPRVRWEIEHNDKPEYVAAAGTMFDLWNRYIDVFDAQPGDGTTGPNGTNEIFFATRAEASAKYGINMDAITFAITYVTPTSADGGFDACPKPPDTNCGTFAETDVIMNAEFLRGYRPSGPIDYSDTAPALYQGTAAHEVGHAIGFHHNVNNISVMNLYEDFAAQYIATADTQEGRRAYPSQARVVTDLAVYPFFFDPQLTDYAATTPVEVRTSRVIAGGTITVRNFGFENVGSEAVSNVEVRFYLSRDPDVTTADSLVASLVFSGTVAAGAFWEDAGQGRTFAIPNDVALGAYSFGALVTYSGGTTDPISYNNTFIAPQQVSVVAPGGKRRSIRH